MNAVQITMITLAIFGVFLVWAHFATKRIIANWRAVAARLGLRFEEHALDDEPAIRGQMRGVELNVMVRSRPVPPGSGCGIHHDHLCVMGEVEGVFPCSLIIQRRQNWDVLSLVFSDPVIKSGDADLDARFVFRGVSSVLIPQLVRDPAVKRVLLRRARWVQSVVVQGNSVRAERHGLIFSQAQLGGTIQLCAEVAHALQTAGDSLRRQRALPATDSGLWQPAPADDTSSVEAVRPGAVAPGAEDEESGWW